MDDWSEVLPAVPSGDVELRHGYTLGTVNRLATGATKRDVWHQSLPFSERLEIAYSAMVEYLYITEERPTANELINAAWKATRRCVEDEWHTHGVSRANSVYDGAETMPCYQRYWSGHGGNTPSAEERVVERLALWQIWARLGPRQQELLLALAAHRDYGQAASHLNIKHSTFIKSVGAARRDFYRLWYEGEKPPRKWGSERSRTVPGVRQATMQRLIRQRRRRRAQINQSSTTKNEPGTQSTES